MEWNLQPTTSSIKFTMNSGQVYNTEVCLVYNPGWFFFLRSCTHWIESKISALQKGKGHQVHFRVCHLSLRITTNAIHCSAHNALLSSFTAYPQIIFSWKHNPFPTQDYITHLQSVSQINVSRYFLTFRVSISYEDYRLQGSTTKTKLMNLKKVELN